MLNYVNSVSCTVSENKNEFILTFRQLHPIIGADGNVKERAEDVVSELVMNHELALALKTILDGALSTESIVQ